MKEDEMGGACGVHGRNQKSYKIIIRKPQRKKATCESKL
jgi:hypothetical protein